MEDIQKHPLVQAALLLSDHGLDYEDCPGDRHAPCGDYCPCYVRMLADASLVATLSENGVDSEEARLFLEEQYENSTGAHRSIN